MDIVYLHPYVWTFGLFWPRRKDLRKHGASQKIFPLESRFANGSGCVQVIPSANYGPLTDADMDKLMAVFSLIDRAKFQHGSFTGAISFRDSELLRAMGKKRGKKIAELKLWSYRLLETRVILHGFSVPGATEVNTGSDGLILGEHQASRSELRFFTNVTVRGQKLPSGEIAKENHIQVAPWLCSAINRGELLALDHGFYRELRTPIGKILYPLIWTAFFSGEKFQRDAQKLFTYLGVKGRYTRRSWIRRVFDPTFAEYIALGGARDCNVVSGKEGFKVVISAGERFYDFKAKLNRKSTGSANQVVSMQFPPAGARSQNLDNFEEARARWQQARESIKAGFDPHMFESWIQPIRAEGIDGDVLVLSVPTLRHKDWIEQEYLNMIRKHTGCEVKLVVRSPDDVRR